MTRMLRTFIAHPLHSSFLIVQSVMRVSRASLALLATGWALVALLTAPAAASRPLAVRNKENLNLRPLIGVLSQARAGTSPPLRHLPALVCRDSGIPHSAPLQQGDPAPKGHSYIAASYIKMVQSAGARAVPILCDMDKAEIKRR